MKVHKIQIVVDSMSFKEASGSIMGFWNHYHLARNLPLRRNNLKEKYNQKNI